MSKNNFKQAVESTPDVAKCYQNGYQALGKYSKKVEPTDKSKCEGSIDIDDCTVIKYPNANRWDYAVGYDGKVVFIEVHSANTSQVSVVLKKLQWLKDWLETHAPEIKILKMHEPAFIWVRSGKNYILPNDNRMRNAAAKGIYIDNKAKLE